MKKEQPSEEQATPFKKTQLRHRRRGDNPNRIDDLDDWIDFGRPGKDDDRIIPIPRPDVPSDISIYRGPLFGLRDFPGFVFAPQALGIDIQKELAFRSVTEYCEAPHTTNIDQCPPKANEEVIKSLTMWQLWKDENKQEEPTKKKQKTVHSGKKTYRSFKKLSWATMGYHYDWTERSYNKNLKSEMPSLVGDLSTMFARTSLLLDGVSEEKVSFAPSASIVNFYTTKSNMGGHSDDLEFAMDKPVVSLSIGLPAVFLLGGKNKEDEPVVPILIRSGDVLCMGGESRLNYHGMARLLPSYVTIPPTESCCCPTDENTMHLSDLACAPSVLSDEDRTSLEYFLSNHRININVRQVYHDD
jgi:alkylated DNA repair protein alkB family protein 1